MTRKVVLVSGAGGFIGRWSVPPLLGGGFDVHAVVGRPPGGEAPAELRGAALHYADLLDASSVEALVQRVRPTHLLHFAWIATPGVYWNSPENLRWAAAGMHLLRCFHEVGGERVVAAGTCAEYDWSRVGVCREDASALADPAGATITPYARSKLEFHDAMAAYARSHGLSAAWGRVFFQFGPHEHPDRLVASVIVNLLHGRPAPCTHGRQIRSFLHVADVGAAFAALLNGSVEGPVNIGSGAALPLAQLLERVGAQIGRPELLRLGIRAAPPTEPPLLIPDVERLQREVAWRPRFNLDEGIADTIAWWRRALRVGGAG